MILDLIQVAGQVAQEAAKAVVAVPQHGDAATEVVPYFTSAAAIVYIQKIMKGHALYAKFVAVFPGADKWAHRFVAAFWALWTALGLHFVYEGDPDVGYHLHLITPAVTAMLHGIGDFGKLYLLQHVVYDATQKGKTL